MFFYEMVLTLSICVGLMWIERRFSGRLRPGDLLGLYVIFYFGGRFFLEFLKLDAPALGQTLTIAQVFSIIAVLLGFAFLIIRHRIAPAPSGTEPVR
jgi:phosphatidylglycerol:prolipoprotein diacylglycerol transferase